MLEKVLQTITDQPLKFSVRVDAWGILKLLRIKRVRLSIHGATYFTLLKISPLIERVGLNKDPFTGGRGEIIKLQCRIAALAILNDPFKIRLFSGMLSRFLMRNLEPKQMAQLMALVVNQMNNTDFLSSIALTIGLQIQRSQTSLEDDTGEKIAPGSQSDS